MVFLKNPLKFLRGMIKRPEKSGRFLMFNIQLFLFIFDF